MGASWKTAGWLTLVAILTTGWVTSATRRTDVHPTCPASLHVASCDTAVLDAAEPVTLQYDDGAVVKPHTLTTFNTSSPFSLSLGDGRTLQLWDGATSQAFAHVLDGRFSVRLILEDASSGLLYWLRYNGVGGVSVNGVPNTLVISWILSAVESDETRRGVGHGRRSDGRLVYQMCEQDDHPFRPCLRLMPL